MDDELRESLTKYFERDIGRPPPGVRERVLAGLEAPFVRPRRLHLAWPAALVALVLGVMVVATMLEVRNLQRTEPADQHAGPVPRSGAAIGYDESRHVLVMFGGTSDGTTALRDTWTWDGARWTELHPAVSPSVDMLAPPVATPGRGPKVQSFPGLLMASDAARGSMVLYGIPGSTWTWAGRNWQRHATSPPPRGLNGAAAMGYDPVSKSVLLYISQPDGNQTWGWDGATWKELHPRTSPDVNTGVMAFDGHRLLLFGPASGMLQGQVLTNTWAWDGTDWSLLSPAVRLPFSDSYAAAYDRAVGRLVAVVDYSSSSETWIWDGASWSREHPEHEPSARSGAVAWYDSRAHLVRLYGGLRVGSTSPLGDIWGWDGNDWKLEVETKR